MKPAMNQNGLLVKTDACPVFELEDVSDIFALNVELLVIPCATKTRAAAREALPHGACVIMPRAYHDRPGLDTGS